MEIEFEINPRSGHLDIPVSVNGEGPFRFALDTGAVATTLSTPFTKKLNIRTYDERCLKPRHTPKSVVQFLLHRGCILQILEDLRKCLTTSPRAFNVPGQLTVTAD